MSQTYQAPLRSDPPPLALLPWTFLSPILYPLRALPQNSRLPLLHLNPTHLPPLHVPPLPSTTTLLPFHRPPLNLTTYQNVTPTTQTHSTLWKDRQHHQTLPRRHRFPRQDVTILPPAHLLSCRVSYTPLTFHSQEHQRPTRQRGGAPHLYHPRETAVHDGGFPISLLVLFARAALLTPRPTLSFLKQVQVQKTRTRKSRSLRGKSHRTHPHKKSPPSLHLVHYPSRPQVLKYWEPFSGTPSLI